MDFPNTTRNIGSGDRFLSTASRSSHQSQRLRSQREVHSVSPDIDYAGMEAAVNAATHYFYSLQEKENASKANQVGAYRVDVSGRETPIPKKIKS